ncbi:MAG: tetratricopeptide repeat protein [Bacteroidetes bacterium]|nr:tetratricopeptide repeat protein [Bacteroidota bacterium]
MKKIETAENIPKWALLAVLLLTAFIYSKALYNGFTNFDDDYYILKNPFLKDFNWQGIKAIFTSFYCGNYHPFTTLTYLFEYSWFGLNPLPYHLLNVLLHLLNTLLVFKFTEKLSSKKTTALVVSLLFALHPMHVESVAWISERKDVLYAFFYLLSLFAYLRYLESGYKAKQYMAALMFFVASLLSKSAAVTLPVIIFAIDIYKGRKINTKLVLEKIPFFLLSLIFGIVTLLSQATMGAIYNSMQSYGFINKIFLFTSAVSFYIIKMIAPFNLSAMHYFPNLNNGALPWQYYASLPFLLIVTWLLLRITSFRKEIIFGTIFFLIAISVMLQIVSVGSALVSERYTYISYIGFFYIAGQWISGTGKKQRKIVIGLFSLYMIIFSVQTWNRIDVWKDGNVLFTDVIKKYPDAFHAYLMRGNYKHGTDDIEGAMEDYTKAIQLNPQYADTYYNRGVGYDRVGNIKLAMQDYNKAILLNPEYSDAYYNRGVAYDGLGDMKSAISDYNKVILLKPNSADTYNNRGWAYYRSGDFKSAMLDYNKAISLNPQFAEAFNNRGWACYEAGDMKSALLDYNKAILLNPEFVLTYNNRAALKTKIGDFKGAIEDLNCLLKLNPDDGGIYFNRGTLRLNMNDISGACDDWKNAAKMGNEAAAKMLTQYCR